LIAEGWRREDRAVSKNGLGKVPVLSGGRFHGKPLRVAEADGLRIRESAYLNGFETPWHRHDCDYLAFFLRGTSLQAFASKTLHCNAGTLVFHSLDEVHRDTFLAPEVRILQIEIEPAKLGISEHPLCALPPSKNLGHPMVACLASRVYAELQHMDDLSPIAIEGLVLELLAKLLRMRIHRPERKAPPWLFRVEELIRDRLAGPWRLTAIAKEIGVHPVHLAREFRKHNGCTIGQKIRQLRIEYASDQILHSHRSLSEIALASGFADQSHFCRTFRRFTGMTPSQFGGTFASRANSVQAG
jgi:AraC family transcriptional regulator